MAQYAKKNINVVGNIKVTEVTADGFKTTDGREFQCDVPIWATGAEAHKVTADSDLNIQNGFFQVNDFL